jgi:hypothetical protein
MYMSFGIGVGEIRSWGVVSDEDCGGKIALVLRVRLVRTRRKYFILLAVVCTLDGLGRWGEMLIFNSWLDATHKSDHHAIHSSLSVPGMLQLLHSALSYQTGRYCKAVLPSTGTEMVLLSYT